MQLRLVLVVLVLGQVALLARMVEIQYLAQLRLMAVAAVDLKELLPETLVKQAAVVVEVAQQLRPVILLLVGLETLLLPLHLKEITADKEKQMLEHIVTVAAVAVHQQMAA
jgi:hypothetical protein